MKTKRNIMIVALLVLCSALVLTGCRTMVDDVIVDVIQDKLGYTNEDIKKLQVTPDPQVVLNKTTAMMVGELTKMDNEKDTTTIQDKVSAHKTSEQVKSLEEQLFAPKEVGKTDTYQVPVKDGEITMEVVYPKNYEGKGDLPLVMYIHGGSFSSGSYHTYERMVSIFADELNAIVAFPNYRLAPEHQFPVATEDVFAAWQWLMKNAPLLGADLSRTSIAGDSAGGNLTAGLSIRLYMNHLPQPSSVILLYPNLTLAETVLPSRYIFGGIDGKVYIISGPAMVKTITNYLGDPARATEPYASPLIMLQGLVDIPGDKNEYAPYAIDAKKPVVLAPTLLVVAQADPLRDEAIMYNATLTELGTKTQMTVYPGVSHGFPMFDRIMPEGHEAMMEATKFVAQHWK